MKRDKKLNMTQRPRVDFKKRFLPRPNMYYHSMKAYIL